LGGDERIPLNRGGDRGDAAHVGAQGRPNVLADHSLRGRHDLAHRFGLGPFEPGDDQRRGQTRPQAALRPARVPRRHHLHPALAGRREPSGDPGAEEPQHPHRHRPCAQHEPGTPVAACLEAWAQMPRSEDLRAEMAASYDDFHRVIAATTRDAFAEIGSANVDADALAALIIAVFDGLLVQWQLDPKRAPSAERLTSAAQGAWRR
jgi:hypothetical protein